MAKCNRKICKVCDGSFEMTRGCSLEKRCPACRILYGAQGEGTHTAKKQWMPMSSELVSVYHRTQDHDSVVRRTKIIEVEEVVIMDPFDNGGKGSLESITQADDVRKLIMSLLDLLTSNERLVLVKAYGLDGNEEEINDIASIIGVSTVRVRQLLNQAIKKIKLSKEGRKLFWEVR